MTQETVLLAEHTWPGIEQAIEAGADTVVIGVGSIEQHGPHLPLVMDTLAGDDDPGGSRRRSAARWPRRPFGRAVPVTTWSSREPSRSRLRC